MPSHMIAFLRMPSAYRQYYNYTLLSKVTPQKAATTAAHNFATSTPGGLLSFDKAKRVRVRGLVYIGDKLYILQKF